MSEHPILFTGLMVNAILNGSKTQTRRVVTVPWAKGKRCPPYAPYWEVSEGKLWGMDEYGDWREQTCPYGKPGDRLWVRQTCKRFTGIPVNGKAWGDGFIQSPDGDPYKALLPIVGNEATVNDLELAAACVTVPSIFMPRWASRITLEVTDVRVQTTEDISAGDAILEGCPPLQSESRYGAAEEALAWLKNLWDSTYGKRPGCAWADSPWIWTISFKRI